MGKVVQMGGDFTRLVGGEFEAEGGFQAFGGQKFEEDRVDAGADGGGFGV